MNEANIIIYNDGEIELNVSVENETVWLNRNQISELFGRDVKTIGKHIGNIFDDGELEKFSVVAKFATTASDGKTYNVDYYNLDAIISIGYRVKSPKGVKFRQWATSVLKSYIKSGYAINSEKITHERFVSLESEVTDLRSQMQEIKTLIKADSIKPHEGIFYDGQIYDAYAFVNDLLKSAKKEVALIDNYIDDTVFTLFSKYQNIKFCLLYTSPSPRD